MLSQFFDSAPRIHALRHGPAGPHFEGFAKGLAHAQYAAITARGHLRSAEHFIYWADRAGTSVRGLTEQTLERFGRHLRRCRCPRFGYGRSARET